MTMFKPTLIVVRFRVERLGRAVYDEAFHAGVNIIRGDNSSGKSTILNMLYYGIGGDISDWSEVALLCTRVLTEVQANGKTATLGREVISKVGQPMEIFGGNMAEALAAPASEWQRYPYRRSETRESFSQALFRLLEVPEATSESSGNVTIHQLLRLMYADQLSPVGTLFKFEQFDPPALRDTVGRLVFGAYENELYANELRIKALDREFVEVSSELNGISKLLGHAGQTPTTAWLEAERANVQAERIKVEQDIAAAERGIYEATSSEVISLKAQKGAYDTAQKLQNEINIQSSSLESLTFEIEDAAIFIRDLEFKLQALQDSADTSNVFGDATFQYCPACYSSIGEEQPAHACHLCKTPYDSERARTRVVTLINDTARQLRQSRVIQRERTEEQAAARKKLVQTTVSWEAASVRLARVVRTPSSEARERLRVLQRQAGYIDRQIEDLSAKQQLATSLSTLIERKSALNATISALRDKNKLVSMSLEKRLSVSYGEVEREVLDLLHNDLPREDTFIRAKSVEFDFSANRLGVDHQSYFSASSRVVLRNSFFVGLFAAATKDPSFRHFHFCLLDTIEDKGMQDERSHNFQRLIVQISQLANAQHQIIFGTSMIAPDLDIPTLTVGHYSTRDNRTLEIGQA